MGYDERSFKRVPLSIQILTREFTRLLSKKVPRAKKFGEGSIRRQVHSDIPIDEADLDMPLDDFSNDLLAPVIKSLAESLVDGEKVRVEMLALPTGILADKEFYDGIAVRGIMGNVDGQKILRFDITTA